MRYLIHQGKSLESGMFPLRLDHRWQGGHPSRLLHHCFSILIAILAIEDLSTRCSELLLIGGPNLTSHPHIQLPLQNEPDRRVLAATSYRSYRVKLRQQDEGCDHHSFPIRALHQCFMFVRHGTLKHKTSQAEEGRYSEACILFLFTMPLFSPLDLS